jgi:hypothetical protein
MMDWRKKVRPAVTAAVLLGGLCLSGIFWFISYTEEKVQTFYAFSSDAVYQD